MSLNNAFVGSFGLDIGDLSIKLIQLEKTNYFGKSDVFKIKEKRSISLPPGLIVDGEIQQPEMVRKKLLHILGKDKSNEYKKIKSPWVVVNLPQPKTFIKMIEVDIPEKDLTEDDIKLNAKKHLPIDIDKSYLDWQIISRNKQTTSIIIGAVEKNTADIYTYLLESVGLSPMVLEIEALSTARAMVTANKEYKGEARAILDLGATRSMLTIYDNVTVQFTTDLNFSGELLTTALTQRMKLKHLDAEKLKKEYGLSYTNKHPQYLKTVSGLSYNLIKEIQKSINFYRQHFSNTNPITHITMCGGVSYFKNLDKLITKKLKIEAKPGLAWKNLNNPNLEKENPDGLSYASAIGLALRAIKETKKY